MFEELDNEKNQSNNEIVSKFFNLKYQTFHQSAQINEYLGIEDENLNLFTNHITKVYYLPKQTAKDFETSIEEIKLAGKTNINEHIIVQNEYFVKSKYFCFIAERNGSKTDWVVIMINIQFLLLPEIHVKKNEYTLFKLFTIVTNEEIEIAPKLNNLELDLLLRYVEFTSLRMIYHYFELADDLAGFDSLKFLN